MKIVNNTDSLIIVRYSDLDEINMVKLYPKDHEKTSVIDVEGVETFYVEYAG